MFDGVTYSRILDSDRLTSRLKKIEALLLTGDGFTIPQLHKLVGGMETAISSRLRDLRKTKFGGYSIISKRIEKTGLWQYRLVKPTATQGMLF